MTTTTNNEFRSEKLIIAYASCELKKNAKHFYDKYLMAKDYNVINYINGPSISEIVFELEFRPDDKL